MFDNQDVLYSPGWSANVLHAWLQHCFAVIRPTQPTQWVPAVAFSFGRSARLARCDTKQQGSEGVDGNKGSVLLF